MKPMWLAAAIDALSVDDRDAYFDALLDRCDLLLTDVRLNPVTEQVVRITQATERICDGESYGAVGADLVAYFDPLERTSRSLLADLVELDEVLAWGSTHGTARPIPSRTGVHGPLA